MQFAQIGGITLHFRAQGLGRGRVPIVFINSLGTDFRLWDGVLEALPDITCLRYDKRGHGLSDTGGATCSIDDHVTDLVGLMDQVGIDRAVVCGVSVGGLIAQSLCRAHPGRVVALLLSNTGLRIGTDASWNSRIATVEGEGISALADGILERWFSPDFRRPDNPVLAGFRNMLARQSPAGYAATCAAIRDADLTAAAAAVAVPTVCVAGDHDGATPPPLVEALAAAVPGADYRLIEGAGHLPMVEHPEAFAALLATLVSQAGGDAK
ncbi:MAG TPA: 3-oxoadipate enol-lactonase [Devosiaceae bacterium]|nr:3-oxoadipate enol-lactonase [Devosiaceae bacterium]